MVNDVTKSADHYKKHLKLLSEAVAQFLAEFAACLEQPDSAKRDEAIAALLAQLEMDLEAARHFGLGLPLKKESKDA